ncbi:hypothetical protein NEUTE1DRAFT_116577, partial [Neurospora tetrasperma FGSC 2508]
MSRHQNGQQLEATSTHIPIHRLSSREGSLTANTNDNDPRLKEQEGEKPPVLDTHGDGQSSGISLPQFAQVDGV